MRSPWSRRVGGRNGRFLRHLRCNLPRRRTEVHSFPMRVLGIDCGGEYTGYGVVEQDEAGGLRCIVCGAVRLNTKRPLPQRLSQIFHELQAVVEKHQPEVAAVEEVFYA